MSLQGIAAVAFAVLLCLTVVFGAWALVATVLGLFFVAAAALVLALWGGVVAVATAFFIGVSNSGKRRGALR